jgi:hypothetical protein
MFALPLPLMVLEEDACLVLLLAPLQRCSDGCYNVWQANCTALVQQGWCGTHSVSDVL